MKKVREHMKTDIISFKPDDSVFEVAKKLSQHNIGGAPVVEDGHIVGVIAEADIIKFMSIELADSNFVAHEPHTLSIMLLNLVKDQIEFKKQLDKISKTQVKDMMSKEVVSIHPDANLYEAATIMEKHKVSRLPVIEDGKLIGIIAGADLIKALIE